MTTNQHVLERFLFSKSVVSFFIFWMRDHEITPKLLRVSSLMLTCMVNFEGFPPQKG